MIARKTSRVAFSLVTLVLWLASLALPVVPLLASPDSSTPACCRTHAKKCCSRKGHANGPQLSAKSSCPKGCCTKMGPLRASGIAPSNAHTAAAALEVKPFAIAAATETGFPVLLSTDLFQRPPPSL